MLRLARPCSEVLKSVLAVRFKREYEEIKLHYINIPNG